MVSVKILSVVVFHYKPMESLDPQGTGLFGHQGLDSPDLCRGPLGIANYQIPKLYA